MSAIDALRVRLEQCPAGQDGWKEFEVACIEALTFLFVPPLARPRIQTRTESGTERRDALFPNRNFDGNNNWGRLWLELRARMILFEFKNYEASDIGPTETNQTRAYMRRPFGKLAIMCCSKEPGQGARIRRNSIYSDDETVILFLTRERIVEMLYIQSRGEDPSDLIMDLLEEFYAQHE